MKKDSGGNQPGVDQPSESKQQGDSRPLTPAQAQLHQFISAVGDLDRKELLAQLEEALINLVPPKRISPESEASPQQAPDNATQVEGDGSSGDGR
jgi:hypothetical protein